MTLWDMLRDAQAAQAEMLAEQQRRARLEEAAPRGVCASCGAPCRPRAVYCDADCRDDHERLLAARRRAGQPMRGDV